MTAKNYVCSECEFSQDSMRPCDRCHSLRVISREVFAQVTGRSPPIVDQDRLAGAR